MYTKIVRLVGFFYTAYKKKSYICAWKWERQRRSRKLAPLGRMRRECFSCVDQRWLGRWVAGAVIMANSLCVARETGVIGSQSTSRVLIYKLMQPFMLFRKSLPVAGNCLLMAEMRVLQGAGENRGGCGLCGQTNWAVIIQINAGTCN